jgi:hypothetical protein
MNKNRIPLILIAMTLITLVSLSACNLNALTGSGNVVSQEYDFAGFDEVDIGHAFIATITPGDEFSVVVRIDDNLVEHLVVEQDGNRVRVGLQQGTIATRATMEVDITMPRLAWLNASGASQAQLNGLMLDDNFTGEASGASQIHGDVDAVDMVLEASGASTVFLAGTAGNVAANASGASTIDLTELAAIDAQTEASGASNITVNIEGILDADASGASNIFYLGQPEMGNINTSGGSNVEQR